MNRAQQPRARSRNAIVRGQLVLRDLRIGYGDEEVLHVPSLELPARRITALLGPVAAGKSSLLRHIAGLGGLTPSFWHAGQIMLDGAEITHDKAADAAGIALMPQKARLYSGTALEWLGLPATRFA